MWTIVLVSKELSMILNLKTQLEKMNIITRIKKNVSDNNCFYEIMVPYAEVNDSLNVIIDMGI